MGKTARIILGSILGIIALVIIASFIANPILENKIKKTLTEELPEGFKTNDFEVSVNSLTGSASLEKLLLTIGLDESTDKNSEVKLEKVALEGLSYWNYIFTDKISFDNIILSDVQIVFYSDTLQKQKSLENKRNFNKIITSDVFEIQNLSVIIKEGNETKLFETENLNLSFEDLYINQSTLQEKIPLRFTDLEMETNNIHYKLNESETLTLEKLSVANHKLNIKDLSIQSNLERENPLKKDGYRDITIPEINISDLYFETVDTSFQVTTGLFEIRNPDIQIHKAFKNDSDGQDSTKTKSGNAMPFPVKIESFQVNKGSIAIKNLDESDYLQIDTFDFSLDEVTINSKTLEQKIPLRFSNLEVKTNALTYELNDYDVLSLNNFSVSENQLQINDLSIQTKYSKTELSNIIDKERDHMDVKMPSFSIQNFQVKSKDTTFAITGDALTIKNPILNIYRDKLVADDNSIKPLYSKSLRELPFSVNLDSFFIENASIEYEEKVKANLAPGKIYFSNLNADISNISNTYAAGEKETTLLITATFLDHSPLKIDWRFDVNNPKDKFSVNGELGALKATELNSFARSSMNATLEGKLNKTFFNINGDNENSQVDLRMNYDEFKVEIMDKKNKRNWFLSTVTNIIVKKNTNSKDNDFKEGKATVKRIKDKSFFNYLWINIQAGLKVIMVSI